ncbi:MAG: class I SAM-dependent methyltransferase [Solirubrobacteraceae bacterium]|jgi:O-methyltransferase involved in polyketide biosynthesis
MTTASSSSDAISPTAHYTAYVWARNGLSHPALATVEGRVLFESLRPVLVASRFFGGASLEAYLLTRHRAIDALLQRAIEQDGITQVVEVACGLSPRGWRFTQRYGEQLTYVEADLPDMAQRKREALERMGSLSERHRVVALDALADAGPESLDALATELDPGAGVAVLTEGLLGYLDGESVTGLWRRLASVLAGFPSGRYISDLHIGAVQNAQVRVFRVLLSAFVRGRVHLHFDTVAEAEEAVREAGFASAVLRRGAAIVPSVRGPGSGMVHILEASSR